MLYYVYMLQCVDFSFYTGYTTDLERRVLAHNSGKGARYTRARRPCRLVYVESFEEKHAALSREWHIKHTLTHAQKKDLVFAYQHLTECAKDGEGDDASKESL